MEDKEEMEKFIKNKNYNFHSLNEKLKFIYLMIKEYSRNNNKNIKELNILDVGCGDGNITFPLSTLECNVTSFDMDEELINSVKRKIEQNKIKNITIKVENCYTFEDDKIYDVIIASEIFEHLSDPVKFINKIKRNMADGSYFIITIPNGYGIWDLSIMTFYYLKNKLFKIIGRNYDLRYDININEDPHSEERLHGHIQKYTKNEFIDSIENLGFNLKQFRNSNSPLAIIDIIFKSSIDNKFINIFPNWAVNGWYFVFEFEE